MRRRARTGAAGLAAAAALLAGGCTAGRGNAAYDWSLYQQGLAAQLIESDSAAALASYQQALTEIQQRNGRVPPGLYGDYGFLLYLRGDSSGAIAAFESEKRLFPESAALMDKLITRVRERQGTATPVAGVPAAAPPFSAADSAAPGLTATPSPSPTPTGPAEARP